MLKPGTSIIIPLSFVLLMLFAGVLHLNLAAQGITKHARFIAPQGTAIIVNGNIEIYQPTQIEGLLKLSGNLIDHDGLEIAEGRIEFKGTGQDQVLGGHARSVLYEMEVGPQASLLIAPGKRVTVHGELLNSNAAGGLRLLSDNAGFASLIHASENVRAEVQRYFNTASSQHHMLAAPVEQQAFEPEFYTDVARLHAWYEPLGTYVDYDNNSFYPTFPDANQGADYFLPATGYLISYPPGETGELIKSFDGFMQQGEISFIISSYNQHSQYAHFNLAGNPYPSTIDWNAEEGWTGKEHLLGGKTKHDKPAWVWNEEIQNFGVIHPRSHSGLHNDVSGYIPAMTGFWVQSAPGTHGELLTMDDRVRVHMPPPEEKRQPSDMQGVIRISISMESNSWRDEVLIEYHHDGEVPGAGKKFSSNPEAPQLYVVHEEQNYSLLFLNDPAEYREILLEHDVPGNSAFYLDAHIADDLPVQLILEDRHTNRQHVLTGQGAISLQAPSSRGDGRFVLTILPVEGR